MRLRLYSLLLGFLFVCACGSDKGGEVPPPVATEVTVFKNWKKESPKAKADTLDLMKMAEISETQGTLPNFFRRGDLMSREERDNIQHGYVYPLYFVDRTHGFPARQWEDGYTVKKNRPSDEYEEQKMAVIQDEMIDFWGNDVYQSLFQYLTIYSLIDVRHYSLAKAPPTVAQTCFTVAFRTHNRGAANFCYKSHRMMKNKQGNFPEVVWDINPSGNVSLTDHEAFKLFVVAISSYEVLFDNEDNQKLREIFVTNKPLSAQMHEANSEFEEVFQPFLDGQLYLNGRQ